jgi:hypothetical protein
MAGRRHGKSSRGRPGHHRAQIFRDRSYPVEPKISNLTLLEGAFSHNALSSDGPINGAFRSVIDNAKVAARIAAAHSDHGTAVWIFYPLASQIFRDSYSLRLAGQRGQAFGGPTDRYSAIGANGPQNLIGVNQPPLRASSRSRGNGDAERQAQHCASTLTFSQQVVHESRRDG